MIQLQSTKNGTLVWAGCHGKRLVPAGRPQDHSACSFDVKEKVAMEVEDRAGWFLVFHPIWWDDDTIRPNQIRIFLTSSLSSHRISMWKLAMTLWLSIMWHSVAPLLLMERWGWHLQSRIGTNGGHQCQEKEAWEKQPQISNSTNIENHPSPMKHIMISMVICMETDPMSEADGWLRTLVPLSSRCRSPTASFNGTQTTAWEWQASRFVTDPWDPATAIDGQVDGQVDDPHASELLKG